MMNRRPVTRYLVAAVLASYLMLTSALAGWSYWTAVSNPGGSGAATAASVNTGATPSGSVSGQSVTLSWAASTMSNGQPVDGYLIKRYDAGTLALQTTLSTCAGTVPVTTCIENSVPNGTWAYTVTPVFAANWRGVESAMSSAVTVNVDTTRPTVTINQAVGQADPTNASTINFTVVFSEPVTLFVTGDVTLGGTTGGTKVGTVTGSGTTYNVAVTGMTGQGTVIASIAQNVASDAAGNLNNASSSTDNTVTVDTSAPAVTINQAVGQADPTNASTINFTVVFSEPVTGFVTGDVTLGGTTGGTKVGTVTGSGTTYNVAVTGMTGQGTVIASIAQNKAIDAVGNQNKASTSTDNTVTVDTLAPTVTINQAAAQADPTGVSPINFTVVFSEATTTFATGDVTLSGTGLATTATVTGSGTTYNVAVSGMTVNGTVIAAVGAGVATDLAGNANTASTSTDNTVNFTGL